MLSIIPSIDDQTLCDLAQRIKPVNRFIPRYWGQEIAERDQCEKMYIPRYYLKLKDGLDLRKQSFMWEAEPGESARDLKELKRIITYHECSSREQFKPSIAEVLAAIAVEDRNHIVAFEVLSDSTFPLKHFGIRSFHQAETILFEKA